VLRFRSTHFTIQHLTHATLAILSNNGGFRSRSTYARYACWLHYQIFWSPKRFSFGNKNKTAIQSHSTIRRRASWKVFPNRIWEQGNLLIFKSEKRGQAQIIFWATIKLSTSVATNTRLQNRTCDFHLTRLLSNYPSWSLEHHLFRPKPSLIL